MNWEQLSEQIKDWPSQYAKRTADAVAGAGISLGRDLTLMDEDIRFAQYSAINDRKLCSWCRFLDGKIIPIDHPDYVSRQYYPPQHNCYDKETEVYTEKGWLKFEEIKGQDIKIWALNPKTLIPEWVKYINFYKYEYFGPMIHRKNHEFDMMTSPNHMQFVKFYKIGPKGRKDAGRWILIPENKLPQGYFNFFRGVNWIGHDIEAYNINGREYAVEPLLRFLAYYLSDGSTTNRSVSPRHFPVKIAKSTESKRKDALQDIEGLTEKIKERSDGLHITDNRLGRYCKEFGYAHEKYIPGWIKELSPRLINIFLDAYSKADGCRSKGNSWKGFNFKPSRSFMTCSKRLADDIGELIMKAGFRPSFTLYRVKGKSQKFRNGTYTINHDMWIIRECHRTTSGQARMKKEMIHYDDFIYDIELEKHHILLVRRNGQPVWSGNSCRCLWIYITKWEPGVEPTWTTPTEEELEKYEGRFPFNEWKIRGTMYPKVANLILEDMGF